MNPLAVAPLAGMPPITLPDGRKLDRPHPEWTAHQLRWRWLLDSWEGGEAYRTAVYGVDSRGMPVHNLVRHKREYPGPNDPVMYGADGRPIGSDQAAQSTDDDFQLRRARTPVPTFVPEAIKAHLSRIYSREVARTTADPRLAAFWSDPTGRREGKMDRWFAADVAPLLLALGQVDVLIDHPEPPPGKTPRTRADDISWRLDRAVAIVVLPTDVLWWRLDSLGRYEEVLIREAGPDGRPRYRYWDASRWVLYGEAGRRGAERKHDYGRPPIVRLFDRRRPRCRHVGLPRYEPIAEMQREYYNRDSELILSDTAQAHPLLQGPEDYVGEDGSIPLGPNWLLPKKKDPSRGGYEGFETVDFSKAGAESIRANKLDLRDQVDRAALLTKPAGAAGTTGSTVAQSGVSKRLDQSQGNDLLCELADVLEAGEARIAELAVLVLTDGRDDATTAPAEPAWKVAYPKQFDLASAEELARQIADFQALVGDAGSAPETETVLLRRLVRLVQPGLDDAEYSRFDAEIARLVADAAKRRRAEREASARAEADPEPADDPDDVVDVDDDRPDPAPDDDAGAEPRPREAP